MERHVPGAAVSRLCRQCVGCGPDLGFHADAACAGDHRDHRDLRLACSSPPGHEKPSREKHHMKGDLRHQALEEDARMWQDYLQMVREHLQVMENLSPDSTKQGGSHESAQVHA